MPSFELTARQVEANELLAGPQRHTMLVGGARSGKTFLLTRAIVVRALRGDGSRHAIVRFRYKAVRASVWLDTLPKVLALCFPGLVVESQRQDGYVKFPNDSEIWFGGLDDKERVEKILGQEYSTLYFNECSQIPYSSVLVALTRVAQQIPGLTNRVYYDLNPTGTGHWTYRQFVEHRDPITLLAAQEPDNYKHAYINPNDNRANIDGAYLRSLELLPERQRKRFFAGLYVAEVDGALWTLDGIERCRVEADDLPEMRRVVVAVDPSGSSGPDDKRSDEIGIVVVGLGLDSKGYVLADLSGRYGPEKWGKIAVDAVRDHKADRIVAEKNFGGDMVRAVIHSVNRNAPFKDVTASRGKAVRAEPVAALYEQGRILHVGRLSELEDQLTNFSTAGYLGERSPDRADALVWAATELMLGDDIPGVTVDESQVVVEPIRIPSHWPRVAAVDTDPNVFAVVWACLDRASDTLYLTDEYRAPRGELAVHAESVRKRVTWELPVLLAPGGHERSDEDGQQLAARLADHKLDLYAIDIEQDTSLDELQKSLTTNRLKVFATCRNWIEESRRFRRTGDGKLVEDRKSV